MVAYHFMQSRKKLTNLLSWKEFEHGRYWIYYWALGKLSYHVWYHVLKIFFVVFNLLASCHNCQSICTVLLFDSVFTLNYSSTWLDARRILSEYCRKKSSIKLTKCHCSRWNHMHWVIKLPFLYRPTVYFNNHVYIKNISIIDWKIYYPLHGICTGMIVPPCLLFLFVLS